jgi:broad specificity phosphatase PhoE
LGLLQGLIYAEAPTAQPQAWAALQSSSSSTRIPGGGESLDDLQQRMTDTLLTIAAQYPGGHAACRSGSPVLLLRCSITNMILHFIVKETIISFKIELLSM